MYESGQQPLIPDDVLDDFNKYASKSDMIAESPESNGFLKEAFDIEVVTNTIEALSRQAQMNEP